MEQLGLFYESGQTKGLPIKFLEYFPSLFDEAKSDYYLNKFIADTPWKQQVLKMYNKEVLTPRLTAQYGDRGTDYSYTGSVLTPVQFLTLVSGPLNYWKSKLL